MTYSHDIFTLFRRYQYMRKQILLIIALTVVSAFSSSMVSSVASPLRPAPSGSDDSERIFRNLANRMHEMSEERRQSTADSIMGAASATPESLYATLETAERFFGNIDSPLHDDALLIPFLKAAIRLSPDGDPRKQRAELILEMAEKNRPGIKAANFSFETRDGVSTSLHALPSDRMTMLIFYDPDCHVCHDTFEQIKATEFSVPLNIVAIDAEGDRMLWDASRSSLPEEWTIGFATDPVQDDDIYILQTSPTMYLLDRDKTVILKDTDLWRIKSELDPAE